MVTSDIGLGADLARTWRSISTLMAPARNSFDIKQQSSGKLDRNADE